MVSFTMDPTESQSEFGWSDPDGLLKFWFAKYHFRLAVETFEVGRRSSATQSLRCACVRVLRRHGVFRRLAEKVSQTNFETLKLVADAAGLVLRVVALRVDPAIFSEWKAEQESKQKGPRPTELELEELRALLGETRVARLEVSDSV
jgi:hypothetical protein